LLPLALACICGSQVFADSTGFIRGVTVSCQTSGVEWGQPEMATALDDLQALGARWIAIHPYARIHADGSVTFRADPQPVQVTRPLAWARQRGLGVMLVPHLAYWGSPFSWRGEINFDSASKWNRFFEDYQRWIVQLARLADEGGAGIFCVGLEYLHAEKFDQRWRQIIAAVREVYHGRLTYGANWDGFANVSFWDALDTIGVLAYFPLSTTPDPAPAQIDAGWDDWIARLDALSTKKSRPILFVEVGYDESATCAATPWQDAKPSGDSGGANIQARCLDRALALEGRFPSLAGMFLWKWFPDFPTREHESFDLRTPSLKRIIARRWRAEPAPSSPH
jgi:hypothetical protein